MMSDAQFEQLIGMIADVRVEVRHLSSEVAQLRTNSNGNAVVLNASLNVLQQDVQALGAVSANLVKEVGGISQRLFGTTELAKSVYDMVAEQTSAQIREADAQLQPTTFQGATIDPSR